MSHTPGPWVVNVTDETLVCVGRKKIAATYGDEGWDEAEYNARLIAAAPDLLEVVRDLVSDCKGHINPGLYALAEAAIAKAEGTS